MDTPISTPSTKDFQVAGVSRSGRVRKKSSKLLDFESPEEIEKRTKRPGRQPARYPGRGRPPNAVREREQEMIIAYAEEEDNDDDDDIDDDDDDDDDDIPLGGNTNLRGTLLNSDDEVDNLVQDLVDGVEAEASSYTNDSRVRQSLYMREKSTKRKILKDGKLVTGTKQRKDKGKARYTAYSLWARDVRKRDFPDLDFASAARRLSELWANVSNKEKNAWRRKAKLQATKARTREKNALNNTTTSSAAMASNGNTSTAAAVQDSTTFVNRATTSRTKKLAAQMANTSTATTTNTAMPTSWAQSRQKRSINTNTSRIKSIPPATSAMNSSAASAAGLLESPAEIGGKQQQQQQSSIEAIDAAAHLKLLGESLTVIGERLKEHNGHVALSGSLSVLLDSLLCSMGPLLCMTTQIPGLENKKQLSTNLATTLDNIAYVMPGL
ncbi:LOW QUALITY PROTEIN: FACT complex subunit SSRP1 [Drosophila sulfurigaster albostrigata]|uniref:LOW QUALITY PROTEIN: FACT complex subunit SSRP1 n=1 Tax=Drosophila sulfurigaster albostrigata TaxID=89887 RepID=UPI002D21D902|nr:LOW QUALITY PROTEIN: FACT complex subunit SSRP1 [Drosophila sulfurigaster albostrigata]